MRDMIEVTSLHRPDTGWQVRDAQGHLHQWYSDGQPAVGYGPLRKYTTPTLRWVQTDTGYYLDGESYEIGHHECVQCGETIEPHYCADSNRQFIRGVNL